MDFNSLFSTPAIDGDTLLRLLPLIIWSMVWKGIGMWQAAKKRHLKWFIAILVLNTAGILPIVYTQFFAKKVGKKKK
jgi:methionyl-tRNA synthetase